MQLSIIIPAYNEEERLPRTLALLEAFFHGPGVAGRLRLREVIVVDDGSRDATSSVVRSWRGTIPLQLIRLERNRGKGAAARAGMLSARGDFCLLYDADAATPVTEIPKLAARLRRDDADLVIGSRVRGRKRNLVSMQWHRRLIGSVYHWMCSALIPGIDDAACGAKLFTRRAVQDLFSRQRIDRFAFDIEVLSLAQRRGYTICEMPVRWEAVPGSKVNLVRDSLNMSWCVLKLYVRHVLLRDLNDRRVGAAATPYAVDLEPIREPLRRAG
jgi:dolichyl-phosphate beta-glucosyltransferase